MGEHLVLHADQLVTNKSLYSSESVDASCSHATDVSIAVNDTNGDVKYDSDGEKEPLIQSVECRICQEEDTIKNLEVPCACSGSLKFAHRKCVQRWCDEKGDTICEICHKVSISLSTLYFLFKISVKICIMYFFQIIELWVLSKFQSHLLKV
ncbi:putative E3 ubiquitin-protein ligase MARCH [Helianthus annuus]|nr:putative E3 ubiquitin-protein ligase MARCH [Helianthus annuus]